MTFLDRMYKTSLNSAMVSWGGALSGFAMEHILITMKAPQNTVRIASYATDGCVGTLLGSLGLAAGTRYLKPRVIAQVHAADEPAGLEGEGLRSDLEREARISTSDIIKIGEHIRNDTPLMQRYGDALASRAALEDFSAQLHDEEASLQAYHARLQEAQYTRPAMIYRRIRFAKDIQWYTGRLQKRREQLERLLTPEHIKDLQELSPEGTAFGPHIPAMQNDPSAYKIQRSRKNQGLSAKDIPRLRYTHELLSAKKEAFQTALAESTQKVDLLEQEREDFLTKLSETHAGIQSILKDLQPHIPPQFLRLLTEEKSRLETRAAFEQEQLDRHTKALDEHRRYHAELARSAECLEIGLSELHKAHIAANALRIVGLIQKGDLKAAPPLEMENELQEIVVE